MRVLLVFLLALGLGAGPAWAAFSIVGDTPAPAAKTAAVAIGEIGRRPAVMHRVPHAGRDVALGQALKDIVPPGFHGFSRGGSTDAPISWAAGEMWLDILARAGAQTGDPIIVDWERSRVTLMASSRPRVPAPAPQASRIASSSPVSGVAAGAPQTIVPIEKVQPAKRWTLTLGHNIGADLAEWAKSADWTVVWNLHKDWVVPANTSFDGDFKSVATEVIKTLAANGVLIRAQFFDGNKTLMVTGPGVAAQ